MSEQTARVLMIVLCAVGIAWCLYTLRWLLRDQAWLKRTGGYPDDCPPCPTCAAWWGACDHRPFGEGGSWDTL